MSLDELQHLLADALQLVDGLDPILEHQDPGELRRIAQRLFGILEEIDGSVLAARRQLDSAQVVHTQLVELQRRLELLMRPKRRHEAFRFPDEAS